MFQRVLFAISILISIVSCTKEKSFQPQDIKGILLHNITRQPLPGQKVELYISETWIDKSRRDIEFPDGYPVLSGQYFSTVTNAEGKYLFTFTPKQEICAFRVFVNTNDYVSISKYSFPHTTVISSPYNRNIFYDTSYAEKPGYIKYNLLNAPPTDQSDILSFAVENIRSENIALMDPLLHLGSATKGKRMYVLLGNNVNTQVIDTVPCESSSKHYIFYKQQSNGIFSEFSDSVSVTPYSSVLYNINY